MNNVLKNKKAIAAFIIPGLLLYTVIVIVPVIMSVFFSFYSGSPGMNWKFAGISNYVRLFHDTQFMNSLKVTVKYVLLTTIGQVVLGLLLSLLFRFGLKHFKNLIRTLVFFPVVIPTVAVGQLFSKIYEIQPHYGLLNSLLDAGGLGKFIQPWIGQAATALGSLSIMDVWTAMGFYAVIYYGAIIDIPDEVLESAKIDGCNSLQLFRYIILPYLRPITVSCLLFSFSGTVKVFESIMSLTNGGPGNATTSLSMYMYNTSFTFNNVGYGSAIAMVILLICIIGAGIISKLDVKED